MPALPQLGLLPLCPAVRVVNISNIHDIWTSSKWLTHTLTLLKNSSVCLPAVQVWRRHERFFSPEIKQNWKQTIPTEDLDLCQDLLVPTLSADLLYSKSISCDILQHNQMQWKFSDSRLGLIGCNYYIVAPKIDFYTQFFLYDDRWNYNSLPRMNWGTLCQRNWWQMLLLYSLRTRELSSLSNLK